MRLPRDASTGASAIQRSPHFAALLLLALAALSAFLVGSTRSAPESWAVAHVTSLSAPVRHDDQAQRRLADEAARAKDAPPPAHGAREATRARVEVTRAPRANGTQASIAPRDVALAWFEPGAPRFSKRRAGARPSRRLGLRERRGTSLHDRADARLPPLRAPPA